MFHHNIKGFIVQGGDPTNTGRGGESIWKAPFGDEIQPHLAHTKRGIVSMANSGPGTNGSQFFITYAKQPQLNNVYTVFGQVIDGFETPDLMERVPCDELACVEVGERLLDLLSVLDGTDHRLEVAQHASDDEQLVGFVRLVALGLLVD
jgi:cyclophilin family peptidyl-prolyl cis-trans isomerase